MPESVFGNVITITDLLTICGAVGKAEANMMSASAAQAGVTPGERLFQERMVPATLIRSSILCQRMLQRRLITYENALRAMTLVKATNSRFDDALKGIQYNRRYFQVTSEISDLLVAADVIEEEMREAAYCAVIKTEQPLLALLVERQIVSSMIADEVLSAHALFEDKVITRQEAVSKVKAKLSPDAPEEQEPVENTKRIKLGELLVGSKLISSYQMIASVERGRANNRAMGYYLLEQGALTEEQLQSSLALQAKVASGEINPSDAINALTEEQLQKSLAAQAQVASAENPSDGVNALTPKPDSGE